MVGDNVLYMTMIGIDKCNQEVAQYHLFETNTDYNLPGNELFVAAINSEAFCTNDIST